MLGAEIVNPARSDLAQERGRHVDAQPRGLSLSALNVVDGGFQAVEGFMHDGVKRRSGGCQRDALRTPFQELDPQHFFQTDDVPTERALRYAQGLCAGSEAQMTRDRVESPERVEGERATVDQRGARSRSGWARNGKLSTF